MSGDRIFQFLVKKGVTPLSTYWKSWIAPNAHVPGLASEAETPSTTAFLMNSLASPLVDYELKSEKLKVISTLLDSLTDLIQSYPKSNEDLSHWLEQTFSNLETHISTAETGINRTRATHDKKQSECDLCLKVLQDLAKWAHYGAASSTKHPDNIKIIDRIMIVLRFQYCMGDEYSSRKPLQQHFTSLASLLMEEVIKLQVNSLRSDYLADNKLLDTPAIELIIVLLKAIDHIERVNTQSESLEDRCVDLTAIINSLILECRTILEDKEVGLLGSMYDGISTVAAQIGRAAAPLTPEVVSTPIVAVSSTLSSVMPERQGGNNFLEELIKKLKAALVNLQVASKAVEEISKQVGVQESSQPLVPAFNASSASSSIAADAAITLLGGGGETHSGRSRKKGATLGSG